MPTLRELKDDPIEYDRKVRSIIRTAKGQRNRMQVCIWPTDAGPCLTTTDDLRGSGIDLGRGVLAALQEHLRDEHLGFGFQGDDNYDRFVLMLTGSSLHLGSDVEHRYLQGAYLYRLRNGQAWLFGGSSEQFDEWSREHWDEMTGEGNTALSEAHQVPYAHSMADTASSATSN